MLTYNYLGIHSKLNLPVKINLSLMLSIPCTEYGVSIYSNIYGDILKFFYVRLVKITWWNFSIHLFIYLYIYLPIYLSIYLSRHTEDEYACSAENGIGYPARKTVRISVDCEYKNISQVHISEKRHLFKIKNCYIAIYLRNSIPFSGWKLFHLKKEKGYIFYFWRNS